MRTEFVAPTFRVGDVGVSMSDTYRGCHMIAVENSSPVVFLYRSVFHMEVINKCFSF